MSSAVSRSTTTPARRSAASRRSTTTRRRTRPSGSGSEPASSVRSASPSPSRSRERRVTDDGLMVAYSKDHVNDGPDVDEDEISSARESELCAHYGLRGAQSRNDPAHERRGPIDTRSEEEIEVGSRQVDAGSARSRKWVET